MILSPELLSQGKGDTIQYGSFKFRQDISKCTAVRWLEPSPTSPPPIQPPPPPAPEKCCVPSASDLNPVYETEGAKFGKYSENNYWYYIPPQGATEDIVITDIEKIKKNFQSLTGEGAQFRTTDLILAEFKRMSERGCPDCPTRTTGPSPSLFIYGQKGTVLTIKPQIALTYSDPSIFEAKMWSIDIEDQGFLRVNNLNREYIYYEYLPQKFNRPKNGWVIEKSKLEELADQIAFQLKLNDKEKHRLMIELKLAAFDVPSDRLFIGLIPQKEIEEKLPLTIAPRPNAVFRHHFYLTSAKKNEVSVPPKLSPIERKGLMVVELGIPLLYEPVRFGNGLKW